MSVHRLLQDLYLDGAPYVVNDPGDAGTLYVDRQMAVVKITTAAAETRTLPDPKFDGQIMLLIMETDGGDATITADTAFDEAGNTSITLDDAGDYLLLMAIDTDGAGTMAWRIVSRTGISAAAQAAVTPSTDFTGADSVDKAVVLAAVQAVETLVNSLRSALVTQGIIKGAA